MCFLPLHVQQGNNIRIRKDFFSNYNLAILDHAKVTIGDNVLIAPNVSTHNLVAYLEKIFSILMGMHLKSMVEEA